MVPASHLKKTILIKADSPQQKEKNEKVILSANNYTIGSDENIFFSTEHFSVIVNPDNQAVPGILKIFPISAQLGDWNNWQKAHWIELLQVIRLCELTLIQTFEGRDPRLSSRQDDKLISCFGKQRHVENSTNIYFDIVPRYKNEITLGYLLNDLPTIVHFKDELYGKPFDFKNAIKPSDELYQVIISKLRETLKETDFSLWLLEDSFPSWEGCISCTPANQHPAKTGLVEVSGFRVALDSRSQEEPGRAFCDTGSHGHVPALRYWKDVWIADASEIFAAYRATVNSVYPTEVNREFDWLCLMNLAKKPEGTHTHLHFIPRTSGGKDYGNDFSMEPSTYIPIKEQERELIVNTFQKAFIENLLIRGLNIDWPILPRLSTEGSSQNNDKLEEKNKPENSKKSGDLLWLWDQSSSSKLETQNEEEVSLKKFLIEAYDNKQYAEQCSILAKLADYHLKQKNYSAAAKLLNGAIASCQAYKQKISNSKNLEEDLLAQLKQIEARFVEEQLKIDYKPQSAEAYGINPQHKNQLINFRKTVKERLKELEELSTLLDEETSDKIQQLFKWITQEVNRLLHNMMQDCISLMLMQPPCDYALIGTGSLAREEMTPYSDLECFLLIAEDKPEYKQYFKHLSQLFEIKIINIGETDLVKGQDFLPLDMLNPTQKGFSLDIHKTLNNCEHPQIGTPLQMAQYQLPEHYVNEPLNHLSSALVNVTFVTGSNKGNDLLVVYQKKINEILNQIDLDTGKSLRLTRSLLALEDDVGRFKPKLGLKDEGRLLEVKDDFYRLPQIIIDSLALHQSLKSSSTWDRIDELCINQFMQVEAGQRLKQILSQASEWRLKTYSYYDRQEEIVDILAKLDISAFTGPYTQGDYRGLDDGDLRVLTEAYKTLIPLHECSVRFQKANGLENSFISNRFYDDSFVTAGDIASRLCQYTKAKQLYESALENINKIGKTEENPVVITGTALLYNKLGYVYQALGSNSNKALEYFQKAFAINIKIFGPEHPNVATSYNNLGIAWRTLGDGKKAVEYYEKALAIATKAYDPEHLSFSYSYNNLAETWRELGDAKKAVEYFELDLTIQIKIYGFEHLNVAGCYSNLGVAWRELGDAKKAMKYYEKALRIYINVYGSMHPNVARTYNNLGIVWGELGDAKKAVGYFEKALMIYIKVYSLENPNVGICYQSLGGAWHKLGDSKKAVEYYKKALAIAIKAYGPEHPDVAACYNKLGVAWQALSNGKKAVEYYEKALEIAIKIYSPEHPDVASSYSNLGVAWRALGDSKKAVEYYERALEIDTKLYGPEHPSIAICYSNLGLAWQELGDSEKAVEYYEKALAIDIKTYGPDHPNIAIYYNNLGIAWQELDDSKKAMEYYDKALAIDIKTYGPDHPNVAIRYNNLGTVWRKLGNGKKAVEHYEKALAIDTKIYGLEHPNVVRSYNNLGLAWQKLGDTKKAVEYYEKALKFDIKVYGPEHPNIAIHHYKLGEAWQKLGNAEQVVEHYEKAIAIDIKVYGPEHPNVAGGYNNLGLAWQKLGDVKKAVEYYEKALTINIKIAGSEHVNIATLYSNLGIALLALGDTKKALEYCEKGLGILKKKYPQHPDITSLSKNRNYALDAFQKQEKSIKIKNLTSTQITIPLSDVSLNYIQRLEVVLGKDIVQVNSEINSVSFPLCWLRQLGGHAIDELSTELNVNFNQFLKK